MSEPDSGASTKIIISFIDASPRFLITAECLEWLFVVGAWARQPWVVSMWRPNLHVTIVEAGCMSELWALSAASPVVAVSA